MDLEWERVKVVEDNEHLGLIVSGEDEEQKNVDANITKCRNSIFALLGPAFAYRCLISPAIKLHLWKTYNLPVLTSGLSALPIRPVHARSLTIFHHKVLRGFLKLSPTSPTPALYFLTGELPVEATLHINTLSALHNIWSNPDTTVFKIVSYILKMCKSSSTTLSNHIQLLCQKYDLPSPLSLLQTSPPWPKEHWNCLVRTRVTIWHETDLRRKALSNSKMKYLNVQLCGLSGALHPSMRNINTTQDAKKQRLHLKFLTSDFLTNERKSLDQPNLSPVCVLCNDPVESIEHVMMVCRATKEVRDRLLPDLLNTVLMVQPASAILLPNPSTSILTQFVLDCCSLNLPDAYRIPAHNPDISAIYKISRDWAFAINSDRSRLIKSTVQ